VRTSSAHIEFDLPIIDGLVRGAAQGASAIDITRAAFAARVVDALADRPVSARRVSQIDVTDLHDAVITLDNDPSLLHLGESRFRERLESHIDTPRRSRRRYPDIDYVDLRFEQRYSSRAAARSHGRRSSPARKTF
jgi:hypothetical protein